MTRQEFEAAFVQWRAMRYRRLQAGATARTLSYAGAKPSSMARRAEYRANTARRFNRFREAR